MNTYTEQFEYEFLETGIILNVTITYYYTDGNGSFSLTDPDAHCVEDITVEALMEDGTEFPVKDIYIKYDVIKFKTLEDDILEHAEGL